MRRVFDPYSFTDSYSSETFGVIIYAREDITSKMLTKHKFPDDIEALFVEINFRKCKWLLCGLYHPPSQSDQYFFDNLDKALDLYSTYEKVWRF